jgi:hypothetical protein
MRKRRPRLIGVSVIQWEPNRDLYGIACEYTDGVVEREPWGTEEESIIAARVRAQDIFSKVNMSA